MKLLIVDDNAMFRKLLVRTAEKFLGYEKANIITAVDGADALRKCEENKDISFIFTDYDMPNLTGREFLEKLREIGNNTPAIMITSRDQSEALTGFKLEQVSHIQKPYSNGLLKSTMEGMRKESPSVARLGHFGEEKKEEPESTEPTNAKDNQPKPFN